MVYNWRGVMKMSVYLNSLTEDIDRVRKNIRSYEKKISSYPQGSIMIRKLNGHEYIYLKYRKEGKVIQEYVSRYSEKKYKEYEMKITERRQIQKELKALKLEEKEMSKALKAIGG